MRLRTVQMALALALVASAFAFGRQISGQTSDPTFQFHGSITLERQSEIRSDYSEVSEWFETRYDIEISGVSIHIGADSESIVEAMRSTGWEVEAGVAPCFWSSGGLYFLVDHCESPLPFARLYMHEAMAQLARNPSGIIEKNHHHAGPYWMFRGSEEFAESALLISTGQTSLEMVRAQHLDVTTDVQFDLSNLETSVDFWPLYYSPSIGWLALDYLTTRADPDSYIEYFRQRAITTRWEDAFEAAFRLTVEEFYEQFPAYSEQLRQAQQEKEASSFLQRWWNAARDSGRTKQIDLDPGGRFLAWYGIDVPLSWFFETYPSVGLVLQWSAEDQRYIGAIRKLASTHSTISEIRRNSVLYVSTGKTKSSPLELPTPVHSRVQLRTRGNFVPWLGPDGATITEIAAGTGASEVVLVGDSQSSEPSDTDRRDLAQTANKGDILWVVAPQPTRWIQAPIEPRSAFDMEGTLELLDNPEAAEIADTEFTIEVVEGTVVDQDIEVIRGRFADGIAFFRERFDTPRLPFEVKPHGPEFSENLPCGTGGIVTHIYLWCRNWTITGLSNQPGSTEMLVHEYFHTLQHHWNADHSPSRTPSWLLEGAAFQSESVYWNHRGFETADEAHALRAERSRDMPDTIGTLAENWPWQTELPIYDLAYLGVHWLVEQSGNPDSWIDFWQPWDSRDRMEVFKEVFGISIDHFYEDFEDWRAENYPPNP